ncbi:MAG: hypothetical protein E7Z90_05740 [Cyanobacteria bacterium SIG29]|nr:hypothetical protein [Cyanobacteria bacterium SIG29]
MKISAINTYSNTTFSARKGAHEKEREYVKQSNIGKTVGGISLATAMALAASLGISGCTTDTTEKPQDTTTPSAYVDSAETTPETTVQQQKPIVTTKLVTKPEHERKAVWHEVKTGDRLADIVKKYAELDKLTPDYKLEEYYELLEADNKGTWTDRDTIYIGTRIRVDSIMPENVHYEVSNGTIIDEFEEEDIIDDTNTEEDNTEKDTVDINGNTFYFDLGTSDKNFVGDYTGLMDGEYTKLDKKLNGNIIMTRHEGNNKDSNIARVITYDKDGKIIEMDKYEDNSIKKSYTFAYKTSTTVETITDKTAKGSQIDSITTIYDNDTDLVKSREFLVNGNTVASFNFITGEAKIGEEIYVFDNGTFTCDDDEIGSERYMGTIAGQVIRIDQFKNGFSVEYLDKAGDIEMRELFDSKGNLIEIEE